MENSYTVQVMRILLRGRTVNNPAVCLYERKAYKERTCIGEAHSRFIVCLRIVITAHDQCTATLDLSGSLLYHDRAVLLL